MPPVSYLDWNAGAPMRSRARAALLAALERAGNPSSVHGPGREARRLVEDARAAVGALVGAPARSVVFTSGGTEANALALCGLALPVAVSAVEHASVLDARDDAIRLPVDGDGIVSLPALAALLAGRGPMLVSVMAANNETGVVQPLRDVADLVHAHGGLLHCDAVQAAGRIPLDMRALGIDLLSLSAHKIGGPQGVGALVLADQGGLRAMLRGGGQEGGLRAGTENVAGISAFGAAAREAGAEAAGFAALAALRDGLVGACRAAAPETVAIAARAPRIANTACLSLPGAEAATIVMAMDLAGFAISAGAACSSGKVRPSHVLAAMGLAPEIRSGAVRVSLGPATSLDEAGRFAGEWGRIAARVRDARAAA
ncbi:MAG: cysteine desulfurase [Alphaproteobacteria bacterium]|nr:cysteine desulfurase [Alphaproteobacteria bacterium]